MAGSLIRDRSFVRAGLVDARGVFRLVVFVWAVLLGISLASVWPAWQWWSSALGTSLEGDRMLYQLDLAVLDELVQYDRTSALRMTTHWALVGVVLAALLNPLFTGGLLAALAQKSSRPTVREFLVNGIRCYGSFLRAFAFTAAIALVALTLVVTVAGAAVAAVAETDAEMATIGLGIAQAALIALLVVFFVAVLDVARTRLAVDDSRHAVAAVRGALLFVTRHLVSFAGLWLAYLLLMLAVAGVVFGLLSALPDRPVSGCWLCAGSWTTLALGAALWQMLAFGRLWLRTALLASTFALVEARSAVVALPAVVEVVEPTPEAEALRDSAVHITNYE